MHMAFSDEELAWINVKEFGWPIKSGCPQKIKESIERKLAEIKGQKVVTENEHPSNRQHR